MFPEELFIYIYFRLRWPDKQIKAQGISSWLDEKLDQTSWCPSLILPDYLKRVNSITGVLLNVQHQFNCYIRMRFELLTRSLVGAFKASSGGG